MNFKHLLLAATISAVALDSCVDKDIDLFNINGESALKINNLALSLNVDTIRLKNIIPSDNSGPIVVDTIDGKESYAIGIEGSFASDPIKIPSFQIPAPSIPPTIGTLRRNTLAKSNARRSSQNPAIPSGDIVLKSNYEINDAQGQMFTISAFGLDSAIVDISEIETAPINLNFDFSIKGLPTETSIQITSLEMSIPKGLKLSNIPNNFTYNPVTGIFKGSNLEAPNHKLVINLQASALNLTQSGAEIENQCFSISSGVKVLSAKIYAETVVSPSSPTNILAESIHYQLNSDISDITPKSISGTIRYRLNGNSLNIPTIDLSMLPDFLAQNETDLILTNPQIYLNINNPLSGYKIGFQTGLEIAANRPNRDPQKYSPDNNGVIAIPSTSAGPFNFLLSPAKTNNPPAKFARNLNFIPFSQLSNVISGQGVPNSIDISLLNPEMPQQKIERFELNKDIDSIKGHYKFHAPLALKTGSVIIYKGSQSGWNTNFLPNNSRIEKIGIEAEMSSTLPIDAIVSITPIDSIGEKIPNLTISPLKLPANAQNQKVELSIAGDLSNMDGISIVATAFPKSEEPLAPSQTIILKKLKARVSGIYNYNLMKKNDETI